MSNRLVMDPEELIDGRVELPLNSLGLECAQEGADWGESQVELQLARQAIGESVTNRHLTNVEMTVPLIVAKEGTTKLAEAAYKLQQKVGLWQAEGGWLRRDFSIGGEFNGSVAYEIKSANLSGLQGWMMEHKQIANGVTLKLMRSPLCYATVEDESAEFTEETNRELVFTLSEILGTAPGLIRLGVKNKNTSGDWSGLIACYECRDYPSEAAANTTAKLVYKATELTRRGGSTEAERESVKVVRSTSLSAGWLTILDSQISGVGHMTHRGVRRMLFRVWDPGSEAGNVQLRLRWRPLGAQAWDESNGTIPTALVGGWDILDLGEARPEPPALGNERWEWQLQARAKSGSGSIDIARVWPNPTEWRIVLTSSAQPPTADDQESRSPATVVNDVGTGTVAWSSPENAKTSDNLRATAKLESPSETEYLKATGFGFSIPESARIVGIMATVERSKEGTAVYCSDGRVRIVKAGSIGSSDRAHAGGTWPSEDATATYGASDDLWGQTWTPAQINASTFGVAISAITSAASSKNPVTARVDAITLVVFFTEAVDESKVCFAQRSIECRTDGCYRQHPTEEVWGRVIEEGFLPVAPPSGLEGRACRFIVIPTQGDLSTGADSGSNKLSAKTYTRPAYHFAREAS